MGENLNFKNTGKAIYVLHAIKNQPCNVKPILGLSQILVIALVASMTTLNLVTSLNDLPYLSGYKTEVFGL